MISTRELRLDPPSQRDAVPTTVPAPRCELAGLNDAETIAYLLCETLEATAALGWGPHESTLEALAIALTLALGTSTAEALDPASLDPASLDPARLVEDAKTGDIEVTQLVTAVRQHLAHRPTGRPGP